MQEKMGKGGEGTAGGDPRRKGRGGWGEERGGTRVTLVPNKYYSGECQTSRKKGLGTYRGKREGRSPVRIITWKSGKGGETLFNGSFHKPPYLKKPEKGKKREA